VYTVEGNYTVSLIATSECGTDTLLTTVVISSATSATAQANSEMLTVKTISSNVYQITGWYGDIPSIHVQDAMGRDVAIQLEQTNGILLNMNDLGRGIYFVRFEGKSQKLQVKLLVH
ncbi:MAG: T9SS type A sorting domain-containing protein, partial [Flavobacteriia bacterium]